MQTCDWCQGSGKPTKEGDPGNAGGQWCSRCLGVGNINGEIVVMMAEDDHDREYVGPFETKESAQTWIDENRSLLKKYSVGFDGHQIVDWTTQHPDAYIGWLREMEEEDRYVESHNPQS